MGANMRSFKPEVQTAGGEWTANAVRFGSYDEAIFYVAYLAKHWTAVTDTRVVHSDDPVTHRVFNRRLESV
jgi:hypothetical protein